MLPVISHYDIVEGNSKHDLEIKQLKITEDFTKLRRIAEDRDKWKEFSKIICSIVILHYDIVEGKSKHDLEIKLFKLLKI